jgi:SEC-C motif-containing protein
MNRYARCACHSKVPYHKCCKRYHDGASPESALLLMRSRYSAYAIKLVDYIMDSTHSDHPDYQADRDSWRKELNNFSDGTRFDGLKILSFEDSEDTAYVTFTALLRQGEQDFSFTEKSQFVKKDGRWLYNSGEISESR